MLRGIKTFQSLKRSAHFLNTKWKSWQRRLICLSVLPDTKKE